MAIEIAPPFTGADYQEAAAAIQAHTELRPRVGLVLGSGLGELADRIQDPVAIPYDRIPHFPCSTVHGHAGRLVLGTLSGQPVCAMQGRFHFYEGYTPQQVTLPVRVMRLLGVETLILTNAAGGINPGYQVGDLMIIVDHLSLVAMAGHNPLRGPNLDEFGPRFPSMTHVYSPQLRRLALRVARAQGLELRQGIYAWVAGPNFETPAEVRLLRQLGADAVGMSTVPEAMVARHAGIHVLGISTITNMAVDELDVRTEPSHEEVLETGRQVIPRLAQLLLGILEQLPRPESPGPEIPSGP